MKFCEQCKRNTKKTTVANGSIVFKCHCGREIPGEPDDTLMVEIYEGSSNNDLKHQVFVENAPFDLARNIVMKDCPKCGINFLTMISVGVNERTRYSCSTRGCGYAATHEEYIRGLVK